MKHYVESGRPAFRSTSLVEVRSVKVTRPKDAMVAQCRTERPRAKAAAKREARAVRAERTRSRVDRAAVERAVVGPIGYLE